jgi:L-seryl-tRNA(Ser) seleniumtransferase
VQDQIPIIRMLHQSAERIRERCQAIAAGINSSGVPAAVVAVESVIGGGTAPKARLQSYAVSLRHESCDAGTLLRALRQCDPPIIGRIEDDRVFLDLRAVEPHFDSSLADTLNGCFHSLRTGSDRTPSGS